MGWRNVFLGHPIFLCLCNEEEEEKEKEKEKRKKRKKKDRYHLCPTMPLHNLLLYSH